MNNKSNKTWLSGWFKASEWNKIDRIAKRLEQEKFAEYNSLIDQWKISVSTLCKPTGVESPPIWFEKNINPYFEKILFVYLARYGIVLKDIDPGYHIVDVTNSNWKLRLYESDTYVTIPLFPSVKSID